MYTLRKIDDFTEKIKEHILKYPNAYKFPNNDTTNKDFHISQGYTLFEVLDSNSNIVGFVLLKLLHPAKFHYNPEYEIIVGTFNKHRILYNILNLILHKFPNTNFIATIRKSNDNHAIQYISNILCEAGFNQEGSDPTTDISFAYNTDTSINPKNFINFKREQCF